MSLKVEGPAGEPAHAPKRRRRGAELEKALLDAAWAELMESGYETMTYDAVAERASTSRAVLYRRWPAKRELALAAAASRLGADIAAPAPDTGSLRGDVIALMHAANDARARVAIQLAARLDGADRDAPTLADLRTKLTESRGSRMRTVLERARDRGEIATADVPPRVRNAAFDLLANEVLVTQASAADEAIEEIVDQVFLPLVHAVAGPGGRTAAEARSRPAPRD
ncbi:MULTISPECIES: TetR/AcrR family transcriptional regulator [Streptomyces]|jgi:AcrR family transcriptional regulator|uniref:TetR/AcrR family transcriptional regulator n=2 Tax=Streptomyces TaxID=1883 RepID=A0ABU3JA51_9ACTN|nr:AcrR family transcriptional regulator [Streptomyces thermodiastaticus]MDT6971923.1 TetR/AcrR family transcriptional regulator [Streptomyces thermocarboxydus]WSB41840.1 TetR/AcrR family transcriptional regulator [Streptomyces cellulosae]UVT10142.1 TetR/AcrR family transcriptional regulator [Streptomyces thermocarboxydus]WSB49465.1 TetR/AcrR family transcriptional regulator [Streptomyces cellulosae]